MAQVIRSVRVEEAPLVLTYGVPAVKEMPTPPPAQPEPVEPDVDVETLRKQAFEDGYQDGYEKGEAAARAEHEKAAQEQAQQFAALLASAQQALAGQIGGLEDALVEIAFAAVCKLLGEAALSEEGARSLVREAMRGVAAKEGLVVRVSPEDHILLNNVPDMRVELVADDRVALGGCIIETTGGTLDARLEVQLQQLVETLARARRAPAAE